MAGDAQPGRCAPGVPGVGEVVETGVIDDGQDVRTQLSTDPCAARALGVAIGLACAAHPARVEGDHAVGVRQVLEVGALAATWHQQRVRRGADMLSEEQAGPRSLDLVVL